MTDIILQGYGYKMGSVLFSSKWERKYFILFPNRFMWADSLMHAAKAQILTFDTSVLVEEKDMKGSKVIRVQQIGNRKEHCLRFDVSFLSESTIINHYSKFLHHPVARGKTLPSNQISEF